MWLNVLGTYACWSFAATWALVPAWVTLSQRCSWSQAIRHDGPASHLSKQGVPTMGGLVVVLVVAVGIVHAWPSGTWQGPAMLAIWLGFGGIGLLDDVLKVVGKHPRGLPGRYKLLGQACVLGWVAWLARTHAVGDDLALYLPWITQPLMLGEATWGVLFYMVVAGSSHATNLTDGLDGLLAKVAWVLTGGMAYVAFCTLSGYHLALPWGMGVWVPPHPMVGASVVEVLGWLLGSLMGFLWYNTHPAQLFMGDVGALAIGGLLGFVATLLNAHVLWLVMAFVMVAEVVSVMVQVASFKTRGKRVFRMAPWHHHFEQGGMPETRITDRAWLLTVLGGFAACLLIHPSP